MPRVNGLWAFSIILVFLCGFGVSAAEPRVVATNSWTAAYADLAGARNVQVLAPTGMKHPPEYEISVAELHSVGEADFVVFAGYELMMQRIRESIDADDGPELLKIRTGYSMPVIRESVMKIAASLGSEAVAEKNLRDLAAYLDRWRDELADSGLRDSSVLVHFHQEGLARELGLKPGIVFGPSSPALSQIREAIALKPTIVIDNIHNPVGLAFREITPEPVVVEWLNFPGIGGTQSLLDVLKYNHDELAQVSLSVD